MKSYIKLSLCFVLICMIYIRIIPQNEQKTTEILVKQEEIVLPSEIVINEEKQEETKEVIEKPKEYISYRLTSFWANDDYDTSSCTGSGLCEEDFDINNNGWYTYNGKLVLAAATYECLYSHSGACNNWNIMKEGKIYYNYYDEIEIIIDGNTYGGIILDSCGVCMHIDYEQRLDLFISGKDYAIDRGYKGNNAVSVFKEEK